MDPVLNLIKKASKLSDKKLAREVRLSILDSMIKNASESLIEDSAGGVMDEKAPPQRGVMRGGKDKYDPEKRYNLNPPQEKSQVSFTPASRTLSTRYSPDHVGVMAKRISDGVYQDPITNKIYNWNEGFELEDGQTVPGGSISLQTDLFFNE